MKEYSVNNRKNSIPQWQIDRMKTIIANRWLEVWQIVEMRARRKLKHYEEEL